MKKIITAIVMLLLYVNSDSQSLAVNTDGSTANSSALLDVKSTTKGLLIPRMTKAQKNAIALPAAGLLIFQNAPDSIGFHYYDGSGWTWLANSTGDQWLINGNSNISSSDYIGTTNNTDLRFGVNGIVRTRLNSNNGFWGFGESSPQYDLDVSLGSAAQYPCIRNGLRLKTTGSGNGCDNGFFIGLDNNNSITNASIWNYGNNLSGAQNLRFGLNNFEIMRINSWGFQGLGESNPQYTFDMKLGTAAFYPCIRNGIRMNNTANNNDCDKGLFVGYDHNNLITTASFWNFGDGSTFPSNSVLRFGMGGDFVTGEKMRLTVNGGMGLGTTAPLAKIHIIDITAALLPGLMVTNNTLPPSSSGIYFGLKNNGSTSIGRLWNYQNADIEIGTDNTQRMIISASGNVGITTSANPTSTLQVDGTIAVGVSLAIAGGSVGSPTIITTQRSYLELSPAGGDHYQLPNPASCVGRTYYIRNSDNTTDARLGSVAGSICPGSGSCLAPGSYYYMRAADSGKTVIAISDGSNWIVGTIN